MPKQQRAIRIEQKGQLNAMQALESRSDEELEAETKFRAAAQAILGARAAEKYDAKKAREHFSRALAAARPQERMQLRRMADASLALAERRAGDLKAATQRLGVEAPSSRQLFALRAFGLIAPPSSAGIIARVRGILIFVVAVIAILGLGFGIVEGVGQAAGGISLDLAIFYGIALVFVVLVALALWGRRRQKAALAKRAEQSAARSGGR
jgi:lipopolysaccharide export LptBFGC system permease protein LptF